MTDKDLRKLSRRELVDLIYEMKLRELELERKLERAEKELKNREIRIAECGSIADAALAINEVFAAAQAAADDYLRAVRRSSQSQKET